VTRRGRGDDGQAAVELALVVPLVVLLALALVQVTLVVRDQVLVIHAAREAARELAVSAGADGAREAALESGRLDGDRLELDIGTRGEPGSRIKVRLTYSSPTVVPLVGPLLGDIELTAGAAMRIEQ
jgi:hypothetical protein